MTVRELIEALKNMDPNLNVVVADGNDPLKDSYDAHDVFSLTCSSDDELNACYIVM